jgi:hypothetical protein
MQGNWAVMYLLAKGIDFASLYILVDIGAVPIVWYFLFSIVFINPLKRDFIFSAKTKTNVSSQLVYCIK